MFTPSKYQQDIFNWVMDNKKGSNLTVQAVAGSGKTKTGEELFKLLPPKSNSMFCAFNKHIADELATRLPAAQVRTYHSLGYATIRKAMKSYIKVDANKEKWMLNNTWGKERGYLYPVTLQLISLCKSINAEPTQENLDTIVERYGINTNNSTNMIYNMVETVMERSKTELKTISYNDMCWLPIVLNMPFDKQDFMFIDELQDTSAVQTEMVYRSIRGDGRVIGVGDSFQCVIDTTKVLCYTKEGLQQANFRGAKEMSVIDVKVGDRVLSGYGNGRVDYSTVNKVYKKHVKNKKVISITTSSGKSLTSTPEHIFFAKFEVGGMIDKHYVYLMEKAGNFRIGKAGGYRMGNNTLVPGFRGRGNQEGADRMWILKTCDSDKDARYWEAFYSFNYGIPLWLFRTSGRGLDVSYDDNDIKKLFSSIDTQTRALNLLQDLNIQFQYPHYVPKCTTKDRRRNFSLSLCGESKRGWLPLHRFSISGSDDKDRLLLSELGINVRNAKIDAGKLRRGWRVEGVNADLGHIYDVYNKISSILDINMIEKSHLAKGDGLDFIPAGNLHKGMSIFIFDGNNIIRDTITNIEHNTYTGYVYDLDIERTHNFIANGIPVHNSIYSFRGASIDAIDQFNAHMHSEELPLSITYRCPKSVVKYINSLFPEIPFEAAPWAIEGSIQDTKLEKFYEKVGPGDMVLCRTNAPLVKPCFALIRRGIKATIKGKDIGVGLIALMNKMKSSGIDDLINKVNDYMMHETERLYALNKDSQAQGIEDTVMTLIELAMGSNSLFDLENNIKAIFDDDSVPAVTFSSVHRAKGLEAERVYILHPELMPNKFGRQAWEKKVEKNVLYVALSRTKNELIFVH